MSLQPERCHTVTVYIPDSPETALIGELHLVSGRGTTEQQLREFGTNYLDFPLYPHRSIPSLMVTKPYGETAKDRNKTYRQNPLFSARATHELLASILQACTYSKESTHFTFPGLERRVTFVPLESIVEHSLA